MDSQFAPEIIAEIILCYAFNHDYYWLKYLRFRNSCCCNVSGQFVASELSFENKIYLEMIFETVFSGFFLQLYPHK